jgi:hypothetical protein
MKFMSHKEMAAELGLSYTSFWRKIRKVKMDLPKGLICPQQQQEIRLKLGTEPLPEDKKPPE